MEFLPTMVTTKMDLKSLKSESTERYIAKRAGDDKIMTVGHYKIGMVKDSFGHAVYYLENKETNANVTASHSLLWIIKFIAERR